MLIFDQTWRTFGEGVVPSHRAVQPEDARDPDAGEVSPRPLVPGPSYNAPLQSFPRIHYTKPAVASWDFLNPDPALEQKLIRIRPSTKNNWIQP